MKTLISVKNVKRFNRNPLSSSGLPTVQAYSPYRGSRFFALRKKNRGILLSFYKTSHVQK